ncbi:restriction endonuclease subunit S [Pseudomonas purpurea]|uniref:restriction endonuclease subunit S n=1 Tax=Pseudomonas purpurea TaxID=3136737 RepID=UPI0032660E4E
MSHYKPYPAYKDSGVEWLGRVPEHWEVVPLKWLAAIQNGRDYKAVESDSEGYPVFGSGGAFTYATEYLFNGESVLLGRKGTVDKPLYVNGPFWTVDTMYYTLTSPKSVARYLYYCALTIQFDRYSTNTALPSMTQEVLGQITFATPSVQEQRIVATHLDRETDRIDGLLERKTRFIELLREKRQTLITHAVSKGLDPRAKMKGIEVTSVKEIPEQWSVRSFKHLANIRYGIGEPPAYKSEGTPLIRATNVDAGKIKSKGLVYVDPLDIPEKRIVWLAPGDIIVVRSGAYTGDSAIVREEHCPSIAGFDMVASAHSIEPDFLQYALLSDYLKSNQIDLEKMRAAQPHLNAEELGACFVLVPPKQDQEGIVNYLNQATTRLDTLITKTELSLTLLKERRSALITAAVTGQIDLREAS